MEVVTAFFDFVQYLADWFTGNGPDGGLTGWFQRATEWLISELFMLWLKGKIWVLQTAWGAARLIIEQIGVGGMLTSFWGNFTSDVQAALQYFRVPWAVNFLIQCFVTRLVIKVVM